MKAKRLYAGIMALTMTFAGAAFLSSCSSDELISQGGDDQTLTVKVSPSNTVTRAAAHDVQTGTENQVNQFVVGIFDSEGKKLGIEKQTVAKNSQLTVTAAGYKIGNKVLVAVNMPSTLFDNVTDESSFKNTILSIGQALYGDPNHVADNKLADNQYVPMYGEGTLVSAGKAKQYKADVKVYHLVSKISLQSITVNFSNTYKGATFQPTEIFLANVPTKVGLGDASDVAKYTFASNDTYVSGEYATEGATVKDSDYPYLSTGDLSTGDSKWDASVVNEEKVYNANMPTLYSLPNDNVDDKATFLVVKGKFSYNGKNDETVYYPFYMNYNTTDASAPDGGTPKALHPNINYQVSITITGKGTNSPVTPVSSKVASVNVSVKDFVAVNQEYHDAGGFDEPAVVGEYVFNDGTWGKLENISATHYPIAVIFSNSTSEADKAKGYTHGYAMALVQAGPACAWATSSAKGVNAPVQDKFLTNIADIKADMDGLSETNKVLALSDAKTADELKANYPSFYYATHFGTEDVNVYAATSGGTSALKAPDNVSPWYLGSIGQYYLVAKNLGGNMSSETDASWQKGGSTYWYIGSTSIANAAGVSTYITAAAEAMTKAGVTAYTPGGITCNSSYTTWYWTSSEFSAGHGFSVHWVEGGSFHLSGNLAKSYVNASNRGVRPVLAF